MGMIGAYLQITEIQIFRCCAEEVQEDLQEVRKTTMLCAQAVKGKITNHVGSIDCPSSLR